MNAAWIRFLPYFARAKLDGRYGLQAALSNSGWLVADKLVRMGGGLFVTVWIARYLGPTEFGLWSYAIAFTMLFGVLASLGLDGIVVRELVRTPGRERELLGSAFALKLAGSGIALLISLLSISLVRPGDALILALVGVSATSLIFQSFNVIDFHFQARVISKFSVYAANGAFILVTISKIILLVFQAPLLAFAWAALVEAALTAFFLVLIYWANRGKAFIWTFNLETSLALLRESWPLCLSGLTVMIYMRVDQVMIGQMLGDREVGLYSAATRISEAWYFIPIAIASSAFPAILKAKQVGESLYASRVQLLYDVMTWLGISVAVVTTFLASLLIQVIYGPAYEGSAAVLSIQIWAGIILCIAAVHGKWLLAENLQQYNLIYTSTGAVINVVVNLLLIPKFGITGAAIATLVAQFTPLLMQVPFKAVRRNLAMILRSFGAPLRLFLFVRRRCRA